MFLKLFPQVSALHAMKHNVAANVGAVEQVAVPLEIQAPGVATTFTKKFKRFCHGVVTPHTLLKLDSANVGCDGTSLATVKPAVRSPSQGIGYVASFLHPEAFHEDFRIAIGNIVVVSVWVKQKVRYVEHKHTAMAKCEASGKVQPGHKVFCLVGTSVTVSIFQNRNSVGPWRTVWRRLGNPVVLDSRITVDVDTLQPRGIWILQVLYDPQPTTVVEFDRDWLPDKRFASHQIDCKTVGHGHAF